jgi:hypothetical protein
MNFDTRAVYARAISFTSILASSLLRAFKVALGLLGFLVGAGMFFFSLYMVTLPDSHFGPGFFPNIIPAAEHGEALRHLRVTFLLSAGCDAALFLFSCRYIAKWWQSVANRHGQ